MGIAQRNSLIATVVQRQPSHGEMIVKKQGILE